MAAREGLYGKGRYNGKDLGDLSRVMAHSRDPDELLDAWRGWRTIAPPMREPFARYVTLATEGARDLGYADLGALWRLGHRPWPDALFALTGERDMDGAALLEYFAREALAGRAEQRASGGPLRASVTVPRHRAEWPLYLGPTDPSLLPDNGGKLRRAVHIRSPGPRRATGETDPPRVAPGRDLSMKRLLTAMVAALMMVALTASTAFGASSKWTLTYYVGDDLAPPQVAANPHRGTIATFAFTGTPDQALLTSDATGYVKNGNLFGKAVTTRISITGPASTYDFIGYDTGCSTPPTVRFYFETERVLGAETTFQPGLYEDQLWWSNPVSISLAALFAAGPAGATRSVSFDPANWSNLVGTYGNNLVGTYASDFRLAASSVSQVGFSFGSGCTFAFGDGSNPAGALFNVLKFSTYTP